MNFQPSNQHQKFFVEHILAAGKKYTKPKPMATLRRTDFGKDGFLDCYNSFNQYLRWHYSGTDRDMINSFVQNFGATYQTTYDGGYPEKLYRDLTFLQKKQVPNLSQPGKSIIGINDPKDLSQVIDYLYVIRCNFNHGSFSVHDELYQSIAIPSFEVFYLILFKILRHEIPNQ
ncbi:MAG: hypothetical protein V1776_03795 [Candidatus Diapherotrites archaeon]